MGPNLFRFLTTVKRSNVSSASASTATLSKVAEKDAYVEDIDIQPHPLFRKIPQTWDNRCEGWTEIQRAQMPAVRPIPSNTKIVAYNRKDITEGNNDHIWVEFRSQTLVELLTLSFAYLFLCVALVYMARLYSPEFQDMSELMGTNPGLDARLIYNKRERLRTCIRDRCFEGADLDFADDPEAETTFAEDTEALQLLLDYIESEFEDITNQLNVLARQQKEGNINWNLLWAVCKKGMLMQSVDGDGEPTAFQLTGWGYKEKAEQRSAQFRVYGRFVRWTGYQFTDGLVEHGVEHFAGSRPWRALPFQPILEHTREELIERGNVYLKTHARVMIDVLTYRKRHSDEWDSGEHNDAAKGKTSHWRKKLEEGDPDIYLLPATIHGWDFRSKTWRYFHVMNLSPIDFNKDAFGHLVLQEKYKRLILAFVNAHTRKDKKSGALISDVIKGKGGGMIMLLHGSPGTGKTLTAEAVADHLQRPLYAISCGELSFHAATLESQLSGILELAAEWNSVVLIDEADIYLQARNNDIERSALVSVFLRVLEYHNGFLILTTNRVETFDEAFQSRISIALKYPDLDQASRKVLWTKFLNFANAITPENREMWDQELEKLSLRVMNSRDIKNAVRSAQTLSFEEDTLLDPSHVDIVLSISDEFTRSIRSTSI